MTPGGLRAPSAGPALILQSGQASSAPSRGAYVVEETQELLLPARGAPGATGGPAGNDGEASAPRPSVLNAASAAAAAYREPSADSAPPAEAWVGAPPRDGSPVASWLAGSGTAGAQGQAASAARRPRPWEAQDVRQGNVAGSGGAYRAAANQPAMPAMPAGTAQRPAVAAIPPHAGPSHVGWHAAEDWGAVSITMSANTAAGFSYLFGWLSGIFFFFGERQNRYVRFHAMQSILLTVPFTVLAIGVYVLVNVVLAKQLDLVATALWLALAALITLAMLGAWLFTLAAAWSGHYLRLPVIGFWADYFSAPPQDPYAAQMAE